MSSSRVNPALLAIRREGAAAKSDAPSQGALPFDKPAAPLTVSQVTSQLRQVVERSFSNVLVAGEITGLKAGHGGHCYFCLKDDGAKLDAVMWRREFSTLKFKLESGMQVVARGRLAIYPPHGKYQLNIDSIEPVGAGALQAGFEQLKAKLAAEGLFAAERKRALCLLPRTVAVVTSPTGAVIQDIVRVALRRFPNAQLLLFPAKVQGPDAAPSIVYALKRASAMAERAGISTIIVGRGGGSAEELWCFNDERVARAVVACPVPVVSAVGHETDFTICDFVADVRAPTPSVAAELVWPMAHELRSRLGAPVARMHRALRRDLQRDRRRLEHAKRALGDGRALLRDSEQRLDSAMARIERALRTRLSDDRLVLQRATGRIERSHPAAHLASAHGRLGALRSRITAALRGRLKDERSAVDDVKKRLQVAMRAELKDDRARIAHCAARLHALSPLAVLTRGYSLTRTEDGRVVRAASDVAVGSRVDIRVARGQIRATVDAVVDTKPSGEGES